MNIDTSKLTPTHGYMEGGADQADPADAQTAIDYKREVCRNYINLSADQIDSRLGGTSYFVTRKYDGEMNVLFFDGKQAAIINRSGRIRTGLPCVEDACQGLRDSGVDSAIIPAELYADESEGRTRVFNVLNDLSDEKKIGSLRLAVFDILQIDGEAFKPISYKDTHDRITELFRTEKLCQPVECVPCKSKSEVKEVYADWVETGGAEGLVVRTDMPLVYKIKPRYTIDVAVVGYSEGTGDQKGQVRSLLLAMMPSDDEFQIIGRTGNGFTEEEKVALLARLAPLIVDSQYIETDSNHVAFHMIRPEIVIELMINDVLFDTLSGTIYNPILGYESGKWLRKGDVEGISVVFPIFQRFRDDKKAIREDIRLEQINDFSYVPVAEVSTEELPHSTVLRREVYKKEAGGKLMVQKFLVWKTNKPAPDFPAYVFHYTNFSSDRKDPLQRDVMVSDDESQILDLCDGSIAANVKRGWNLVL